MKRFLLILALLLSLFVTSLTLFFYLFNINDYAAWAARQVEKSTGYQVSFVVIENKGLKFSISGLSVARAQETLLEVDKINIEVARLDLWHRQIEFELVALAGVHLHIKARSSEDLSGEQRQYPIFNLPWDKLQINKLRVSDLNLDLSTAQQSLQLQQANISSDNLAVIEDKKLLSAAFKGRVDLDFATLELQFAELSRLRLDNLSLSADLDLPKLQGSLALSIKQLAFTAPKQTEITAGNSLLELQLDRNRLSLTRLLTHIFSGELSLQAEALLSLDLFPHPAFSVDHLQLVALSLKDMQLTIPAFMRASQDDASSRTEKQKLPIATLFVQQIKVENVDIRSEEEQLPLTVQGLNGRVSDLYLLKNNQLPGLSEDVNQAGVFVLQADYLQWADSVIEAFQVAGSLTENVQALVLLLRENKAAIIEKD